MVVLVKVFIAVKKHLDHGNSYKKNIELGWLVYSFRGPAHCHHGGEHGSTQADLVLELRVLHLDSEAAGSQLSVTLSDV